MHAGFDGAVTDLVADLVGEPRADEALDRYARLVRRVVGVPVGLVTLVGPDRQRFVGEDGLAEPWASARETPLSHSFCRWVVADRRPLVLADARLDERLRGNFAIPELGVVAYAGWPLTDHTGRLVGSLCAIDHEPRSWTDDELAALGDLAAACSSELVQRGLRQAAADAAVRADHLARRSRVLLGLSEALSSTHTVEDVAAAVRRVAVADLGCLDAGVSLEPSVWPRPQRRAPGRGHRTPASQGTRLSVPLSARGSALGTLALRWEDGHLLSPEDRLTVTALAAYTTEALDRALLLSQRQTALVTLQRSLLAPLPAATGLTFAARYRPAARQDQVGGDWYDALVMPSGSLALVVGDVVGHDLAAAAMMGQVRTMLRTFACAVDESPSGTVARLDQAMADLGLAGMATLVMARLEPDAGSGCRLLSWTNAGHPAPVLVAPDGTAQLLERSPEHDPMVGVAPGATRTDEHREVQAGSTLLFYTDGLVERRGEGLAPENVMHAMLETPSGLALMASDTPGGPGHGAGQAGGGASGVSLSLSGEDAEELRGYWERLSARAAVTVPLQQQMWGDEFGMLVDEFGMTWMVNITGPENAGA